MIPQRAIRVIVWLATAVFLAALAVRDVQLDRMLEVSADTIRNRATPYVSAFGPPSRVDASSGTVLLIGEPVYVNLRIPRWFRRAIVEIQYENPRGLPLKLGVRTHPIAWAFHFPEPETLPTSGFSYTPSSSPPESGGGPLVLWVPFDLQRAWQVERNVYRFVFSAPGASVEQPIIVHGLRVTAERDPICLAGACL